MAAFVRWSDWMAARINDRVARNDGRFTEKLIAEVVEDERKFDALRKVALQHAIQPVKLSGEIDKIETDSKAAGLNAAVVRDRQARALYFALKANPDYQYLLQKDGILTRLQFLVRTGKLKAGVIAYGLTAAVENSTRKQALYCARSVPITLTITLFHGRLWERGSKARRLFRGRAA